MNKLIQWVEANLLPPFTKFTNSRPVSSLMIGFRFAFPLILAGAFLQIIANLRFAVEELETVGLDVLSNLSFGLMGLAFALGIAMAYSEALEIDPKGASVITMSVFFILVRPELVEGVLQFPETAFGASNLLVALLAGFGVPGIIYFFTKRGLVIKAEGLPPFIRNWFMPLIPGIVAILLAWLVSYPLGVDVPKILSGLSKPLYGIMDSYLGILVIGLLMTLTFSTGIHPSATVGALVPLWFAALGENMELVNAGKDPAHLMNFATVLGFITLGGQGATFMLNIFMLRSKSTTIKKLGRTTIWPILFGINEPLIYGLPIAFNPILIIPFIINGGIINGSLTYLVMKLGLVRIPWNIMGVIPSPPGVSAFLSTQDWRAPVFVLFLLVINALVYYPFFKAFENQTIEKETEKEAAQ
jgi:PTS system cellobiose-specific IIC component